MNATVRVRVALLGRVLDHASKMGGAGGNGPTRRTGARCRQGAAAMTTQLRKTGLGVLGDMPWGTYCCHFYQTQKELLETLVPYFKAGLESREFCFWLVPEPLIEAKVQRALR